MLLGPFILSRSPSQCYCREQSELFSWFEVFRTRITDIGFNKIGILIRISSTTGKSLVTYRNRRNSIPSIRCLVSLHIIVYQSRYPMVTKLSFVVGTCFKIELLVSTCCTIISSILLRNSQFCIQSAIIERAVGCIIQVRHFQTINVMVTVTCKREQCTDRQALCYHIQLLTKIQVHLRSRTVAFLVSCMIQLNIRRYLITISSISGKFTV